jgi:hypothetical protein
MLLYVVDPLFLYSTPACSTYRALSKQHPKFPKLPTLLFALCSALWSMYSTTTVLLYCTACTVYWYSSLPLLYMLPITGIRGVRATG